MHRAQTSSSHLISPGEVITLAVLHVLKGGSQGRSIAGWCVIGSRSSSLAERHLLLFVDPACSLCETIYPAAKAAHEQLPTILIFPEAMKQVDEYIAVQDLESISAVRDAALLNEQLSLTGTPTALYIEANRIIDIGSGDQFALSVIEVALDNERRGTRYSFTQ